MRRREIDEKDDHFWPIHFCPFTANVGKPERLEACWITHLFIPQYNLHQFLYDLLPKSWNHSILCPHSLFWFRLSYLLLTLKWPPNWSFCSGSNPATSNPFSSPSQRFIYVTYHSPSHSHLKLFATPNCTQGRTQISQQGLWVTPCFSSLVSPSSSYTACSRNTQQFVISVLILSVLLHMLNCLCLPGRRLFSPSLIICFYLSGLSLLSPLWYLLWSSLADLCTFLQALFLNLGLHL